MATDLIAQFNEPSTAAKFLGDNIGTHYSAALRAAKAYGCHLAPRREFLQSESYEGESLGNFWRELIRSEGVRLGSLEVVKGLSSTPEHFFSDFLDTADSVFRKKYPHGSFTPGNTSGKTEHEKCLKFLRNHAAGEKVDHLKAQNNVATWTQLLRIMGRYQD